MHATRFPRTRYRANRFANFWIAWAAGCRIVDTQSGLRVYPREVFERLSVRHDRRASFVFESEVLIEAARAGMPICCVPVSVRYHAPARPSYFRPVADSVRIGVMVSSKLLARGFAFPASCGASADAATRSCRCRRPRRRDRNPGARRRPRRVRGEPRRAGHGRRRRGPAPAAACEVAQVPGDRPRADRPGRGGHLLPEDRRGARVRRRGGARCAAHQRDRRRAQARAARGGGT